MTAALEFERSDLLSDAVDMDSHASKRVVDLLAENGEHLLGGHAMSGEEKLEYVCFAGREVVYLAKGDVFSGRHEKLAETNDLVLKFHARHGDEVLVFH